MKSIRILGFNSGGIPMSSSRVRVIAVVAGGFLVIMLALLVNSNTLQQVTAQVVPRPPTAATPPPVQPPLRGTVPAPAAKPAPPSRPPYLVGGPSFAGKVLHWTQTSLSYHPNSPDPANGESVTGDIWLQVGNDGRVTQFRGRYTRADGSLLQEVVEKGNTTIVVFGAGYPATPPANCDDQDAASPRVEPPFPPFAADVATLARLGFAPSDGLSQPLPSTTALPGVQPVQIYPVGGDIRAWTIREMSAGTTIVRRLEIGSHGRVIVAEGRGIDASGVATGISRQVYGALEVYDPGSVPASVFTLSQQAQEACRG